MPIFEILLLVLLILCCAGIGVLGYRDFIKPVRERRLRQEKRSEARRRYLLARPVEATPSPTAENGQST